MDIKPKMETVEGNGVKEESMNKAARRPNRPRNVFDIAATGCFEFRLSTGEDIMKERVRDTIPWEEWKPALRAFERGENPALLATLLGRAAAASGDGVTSLPADVVKKLAQILAGIPPFQNKVPRQKKLRRA